MTHDQVQKAPNLHHRLITKNETKFQLWLGGEIHVQLDLVFRSQDARQLDRTDAKIAHQDVRRCSTSQLAVIHLGCHVEGDWLGGFLDLQIPGYLKGELLTGGITVRQAINVGRRESGNRIAARLQEAVVDHIVPAGAVRLKLADIDFNRTDA